MEGINLAPAYSILTISEKLDYAGLSKTDNEFYTDESGAS